MLYNPPSGSTDANAGYVGKNIAGGTQGSKVPPAAVEYTQREIVAAIAASGQSPTNGILVQQAMALARGVWVGNLTGTGDLAVATLGVVFPSLLQGMRIGAQATAANTVTNPKLRVTTLGTTGLYQDYPILKQDGSALAVGDIKNGRIYRYEADGAGNVLISGGGLGSGSGSALPAAIFYAAKTSAQTIDNGGQNTITFPAGSPVTVGGVNVITFDGSTVTFAKACKARVMARATFQDILNAGTYVNNQLNLIKNGSSQQIENGAGQITWPSAGTYKADLRIVTRLLDFAIGDTLQLKAYTGFAASYGGSSVYGDTNNYTDWAIEVAALT